MDEIEYFILRIPNFKQKKPSELIDFFAFFILEECKKEFFTAVQIKKCFEKLALKPYSNISAYLNKNCKTKFSKNKNGYILTRFEKERIAVLLDEIINKPASSKFIDLSIFEHTPYYIRQIAKEMVQCYDNGFYNATVVLMRKLVETLIIECFEKHGIDNEIKTSNGSFFYLSDLISKYILSTKWNASRNINKSLTVIKKYGDLSAHNRRFIAKKSDIDLFRFELRQALQEVILTINYAA